MNISKLTCTLLLGLVASIRVASADTHVASADPFISLDTDSDGRLSLEEVRVDSALARRFAESDANHDGFLSPMEFELARMRRERTAQN